MDSQFIEFQYYKYPFLRHIYRKQRKAPYGSLSHETYHERYLRQRNSRLLRRRLLHEDVDAQEFFKWIWSIQKRLNLTNLQFAEQIGVTLQTLKLWRNFHGHYPSQKSLQKLLFLDRIASVCVTKKVVFGITTTEAILK